MTVLYIKKINKIKPNDKTKQAESVGMVFDNIEGTFEFDPCINYLVTPRLPV